MQDRHGNNELSHHRIVLDLLQRFTDTSILRRYEEKVDDFRHLEHEPTVEALRQLLHHLDPEIRGRAAEILLQLDAHTTLPWVLPLLQDTNIYVRASMCDWMNRYGDQRAVDALIEVVAHDPNSDVRFNAVVALGSIGDVEALPVLEHAATYDTGVDFQGVSIASAANHAIWEITAPPLKPPPPIQYTDSDLPW